MSQRHLSAVILAAGEGSRMKSDRPKPLHMLCGKPMLSYVVEALEQASPTKIVVVVGHGAEQVTAKLATTAADSPLEFVLQESQNGTGDAVNVGLSAFANDLGDDQADLLVLPGDTPLLRAETMAELVHAHRSSGAAATVLTAVMDDPTGYGRMVRGRDQSILRIVEERDATNDERQINEINTGIFCFQRALLAPALRRLTPDNAQGEYYLTDVVEVLAEAGYQVGSYAAPEAYETQGVNDRLQLAQAEAALRRRTNEFWLRQGVTMVDPATTYLDTTVRLSSDVTLFPGVLLQGDTVVGPNTQIGANSHLIDCEIDRDVTLDQTVGNGAVVEAGAVVGPFAYLGPGSRVAFGQHTGAFYTSP